MIRSAEEIDSTVKSIVSKWFYTSPVLFKTACKNPVVKNGAINCKMRSGESRIEYNPNLLLQKSNAEIRSALSLELTRILLGHCTSRRPTPFDPEIAIKASDMTILQKFPEGSDLPRGESFEFYYNELLKQKKEEEKNESDGKNNSGNAKENQKDADDNNLQSENENNGDNGDESNGNAKENQKNAGDNDDETTSNNGGNLQNENNGDESNNGDNENDNDNENNSINSQSENGNDNDNGDESNNGNNLQSENESAENNGDAGGEPSNDKNDDCKNEARQNESDAISESASAGGESNESANRQNESEAISESASAGGEFDQSTNRQNKNDAAHANNDGDETSGGVARANGDNSIGKTDDENCAATNASQNENQNARTNETVADKNIANKNAVAENAADENIANETAADENVADENSARADAPQNSEYEDATALWNDGDLLKELEKRREAKAILENADAQSFGRLPGNVAGHLQSLLTVKESRVPDRIKVAKIFMVKMNAGGTGGKRYLTRMRPSRRTGFLQMGTRYTGRLKILCVLDVSGSVSDEWVARYVEFLNFIRAEGLIPRRLRRNKGY